MPAVNDLPSKKRQTRLSGPGGRFNIILLFLIVPGTILLFCLKTNPPADNLKSYVSTTPDNNGITLAANGKCAPLIAASTDYPGVTRVLGQLQTDIANVCGSKPLVTMDTIPAAKEIVLIGTLGKNPLIDKLVLDQKLRVDEISGKWESFLITVLENPFAGVDRALVITGSDKRGTIYGMYDLSQKIGVSPWYWWADVPVKKKSEIYISRCRYTRGEPKVKYRGIFINDEAPALSGWAYEKFGGFNHKFYEKVFDLILRLKGNFLWPAMWGRAFYVDDPMNPKLADEYGVVISTSHHEPMMRAHAEWAQFGSGPWNYAKNDSVLRQFWREGIERMNGYESVVTVGMRGDGDEPMSDETNIALLQQIVKDQRQILGKVTGKDVTAIPQVWALYKEVQEYYDQGMRVPEDITLLLCDDNWGNIRKLPRLSDPLRPGGYGIYYHFDYVGGPRNYKWLNTNQISRVWEQMHLAYEYGARRIWIVNVGDIKPMELPISFFLDYAWDPGAIGTAGLAEYTKQWARQQFGKEHCEEIGEILADYTRYNSRRKPELLSPGTYSLVNYREAETVVNDYNRLAARTNQINDSLPAEIRDAFYQLVLHPVTACANLNELYVTVGKNRLYARQGRASTDSLARRAEELYEKDAEITSYYNHRLANGKWNHMMDQTHIGYTYWQQPDSNSMPEVNTIELPVAAQMGIAVEGSEKSWPADSGAFALPEFDSFNRRSYYIDVFNRGQTPFEFSARGGQLWVNVVPKSGQIKTGKRLWVSIDREKMPQDDGQEWRKALLSISGPDRSSAVIQVVVHTPAIPGPQEPGSFVESNGYVSMEAENYTNAVNSDSIIWKKIPGLGRTQSAMTIFPVTAPALTPGSDSPRLEYRLYLFTSGKVVVKAFLSPTLNFHNDQGLRYGISFDMEAPRIINMNEKNTLQDWEESVRNNITMGVSEHTIPEPGWHVLKFWAVDPGVVLQKLVVETGKVAPSYLGPPQSFSFPMQAEKVMK